MDCSGIIIYVMYREHIALFIKHARLIVNVHQSTLINIVKMKDKIKFL